MKPFRAQLAHAALLVFATAGNPVSAQRTAAPCAGTVRFGGFDWIVSGAEERFPGAAPGFAWDECNARVEALTDGKEILTLALRKEPLGWRGAQLMTRNAYLYGTFSMSRESSLGPMLAASPSAVLGFFAYLGPAYTNEIDVEFTRWGVEDIASVHYTVWPPTAIGAAPPPESASTTAADAELVSPALHRFIWTERSVEFRTLSSNGSTPIGRAFTVTANVPTKPMHIMLNFWVEPHAKMGSASSYEVRISSVTRTAP